MGTRRMRGYVALSRAKEGYERANKEVGVASRTYLYFTKSPKVSLSIWKPLGSLYLVIVNIIFMGATTHRLSTSEDGTHFRAEVVLVGELVPDEDTISEQGWFPSEW